MDSTFEALSYPEVLVRIVKHLPARDIINFRRVCKLWNGYCDIKFVFRKFDLQPHEIDVLLRNTKCRRLHLEFQDCDLKCISDEMWQIWGPKLRSLRLHGCITEIGTLQSVISNCVGLEVLDIVFIGVVKSNLLERLLDYFIERKERHTRLRRLSIKYERTFTKISQLLKILTVFPCIEDLCCNVERDNSDGKYAFSESRGTYDMQKLKSYAMVNKIDDLWSERRVALMLDY